MIIAIADLHLGDPNSNREGFRSFIEDFLRPKSSEISDLVLLGDILDLWKRNNSSVILENLDILNDICSLGFHVHYIVGNHDFIMKEFGPERKTTDIPQGLTCDPNTMTVSDHQLLEQNGKKFRFIHGHQISYWYALPFYEAFSCAMCEVNEGVKEISNVWQVLARHTCNISPLIFDNILEMSNENRLEIERRLAGPLVGHTSSFEESIIKDFALLRGLVEFEDSKADAVHSIVQEIRLLTEKSNIFDEIESYVDLKYLESASTFEEVTGKFVNTWMDIIHHLNSERVGLSKKEYSDIVEPVKRIAAMFCTDLQHDEFLIHGHGHSSYVDLDNQTADCGCWIQDKASYISIVNGEVTCSLWPER